VRRLLASFAATVVVAACGARTPLGVQGAGGAPLPDAAPPEAGFDAPPDVPQDVPADVPHDVPQDVPADVPPPYDCVEAGITYIYVITAQNTLLRFDPPSATFATIGPINCKDPTSPFSMGVDRQGIAWVVFQSGHLYRVSTLTASCEATPFVPGQLVAGTHPWVTFGMGFSANGVNAMGEALYVAESSYQHPSEGLATIDVKTFQISYIGPFPSTFTAEAIEMTGTGAGRLFGFSLDFPGPGSHVTEIDKATGNFGPSFAVPSVGTSQSSFAYAFWGGDFYLFTAPGNSSATVVNRLDPTNTAVVPQVAMLSDSVVGVGVSTCAPLQ
jgi:hypothetical protein